MFVMLMNIFAQKTFIHCAYSVMLNLHVFDEKEIYIMAHCPYGPIFTEYCVNHGY